VIRHLTRTVPDLDEEAAHAALADAAAVKGKALRELDACLTAHPDALIVGTSDCPPSLVRLALLQRAGHRVQPPKCDACGRSPEHLRAALGGRLCSRCASRTSRIVCARCGLEGRVAARRAEGVICYTCYGKDPLVTEVCGKCGRSALPVARLPDGASLCRNCYTRPVRTCIDCGQLRPTKIIVADGPVCQSCYKHHRPRRRCGRCNRVRPISRRATDDSPDLCEGCYQGPEATCSVCGRFRQCVGARSGTMVCHSCLPRPRRACARCGRLRPVNAEWPIGPVCSGCYEHIRNHPAACTRCHTIQPLIGADPDGRPICGSCAGAPVDFACRRCGQHGRLYAEGTCTRCVMIARLQDLLTGPDGAISRELAPVLAAFSDVEHPISILGWLRRSGSARLLAHLASEDRPITHDLLDQLPPGRCLDYVRRVLVHTSVLPERLEHLERITPWLDQILAERPEGHAVVVRQFAQWHVLRRARRSARKHGGYTQGAGASARSRILTALDFLAWLDERSLTLTTLTQADVDLWLTRGPTSRSQLRSFLAWTTNQRLTGPLVVPTRTAEAPSLVLDEQTRWQQLHRCLTDDTLPLDIRAAGAVILLFGALISRVVQLTLDDFQQRQDRSYLVLDRHPVLLPPRLADLLGRQASTARSTSALGRSMPRTLWLFPGRSPGGHVSPNRLSHKLMRHGIHARAARNAALLTLAADLPVPVLADLLGLHVSTATRWARYVQRDWAAYLAARADETRSST
jgi:hypothetical protein